MELRYVGAGPCELAANVLYRFVFSADEAKRLRVRYSRDVIAKGDRDKATTEAEIVDAWTKKNT